jgi:hypothetical protein
LVKISGKLIFFPHRRACGSGDRRSSATSGKVTATETPLFAIMDLDVFIVSISTL